MVPLVLVLALLLGMLLRGYWWWLIGPVGAVSWLILMASGGYDIAETGIVDILLIGLLNGLLGAALGRLLRLGATRVAGRASWLASLRCPGPAEVCRRTARRVRRDRCRPWLDVVGTVSAPSWPAAGP